MYKLYNYIKFQALSNVRIPIIINLEEVDLLLKK